MIYEKIIVSQLKKDAILVKYLGHIVGGDEVATNPEKVQAVKDWATPAARISSATGFLGLTG